MANIHYVEGRNYLGKGIRGVTSILKGFSELQSLGPTFRFLTWQPSLTFLVLESHRESSRPRLSGRQGLGLFLCHRLWPVSPQGCPSSEGPAPCQAVPDGQQILTGYGGASELSSQHFRPPLRASPSLPSPIKRSPWLWMPLDICWGSSSSSSQGPRNKEGFQGSIV